jgi:diadenosine tetraphosphatase ApaH/serine/threonine PP2A family protein phosphatase
LAHGGSSPAEVVDRVRELGWPGVAGNADEMLWRPEALCEFARPLPQLKGMFEAIEEIAAAEREALGAALLEWLRGLKAVQRVGSLGLVHASPDSCWRAPGPEASDGELTSVYGPLQTSVCIYGHVHRPFVRRVGGMTVANSGSVSLSYDGDCRASYLLVDDDVAAIRRVEYDVGREVASLRFPHSEWIARMLVAACPLGL